MARSPDTPAPSTPRPASVDPTVLPADCRPAGADGRTAAASGDAVARANAKNFSYAFSTVLLVGGGILVVASAGFLTLPKRARMANPLLDTEPDESDPVTV